MDRVVRAGVEEGGGGGGGNQSFRPTRFGRLQSRLSNRRLVNGRPGREREEGRADSGVTQHGVNVFTWSSCGERKRTRGVERVAPRGRGFHARIRETSHGVPPSARLCETLGRGFADKRRTNKRSMNTLRRTGSTVVEDF